MKGGAAALAAGTGLAGSATADEGEDLSEWFDNVDNYDGVVDETGADEVTIEVGAQGNDGAFAFGPAAVRVDSGTTVVWEWTGEGGQHNVVAEDGSFESELVGDEGHTFEFTPEDSGVFKYACGPHKAMGMKGALVVGDVELGGSESHGSGSSLGPSELAIGGSLLLGIVSPLAFGAFLFKRDPDRPSR